MKLLIKSLNPQSTAFYENHSTFHEGDAGLDLFCPVDLTVPAGAISFKIPLGVACAAENAQGQSVSYYLYPRSSMGAKTPLRLSNSVGIIDRGYRGEITAFVDNISQQPFQIRAGERYFQLCAGDLTEISMCLVSELNSTTRGTGGFGSTGV